MALLAGLHHERATDPRIGDLLATVEGSSLVGDPDSAEAVNVRELRRAYDRRVRLPRTLVEELARTTSMAQSEWVAARAASDFGRFRPWLEKIIQLKREESACLAGQSCDRGHRGGGIDLRSVARRLRAGGQERGAGGPVRRVAARAGSAGGGDRRSRCAQSRADKGITSTAAAGGEAILRRCYPRDRQRVFGEAVAAAVGFDFRRGRLDVTAHPFCSGIGPGDCRITTRFDEQEFSDAFFGILHEVGHGLYEQGLEEAQYGTPMGEAVSLGVHESQSRLWENLVGRGRSFWAYWLPMARRIFHEALADVTLDQFHAAVNHVAPSLIRVRADEATYNLHIIIRFELEQDLLTGALPVGDLPGAWNQKYRESLGVTPGNDAEGCLQDIHWSAGLIGYFPTYTLGNVYAAQLYGAARAELGGLDDAFARGDFNGLLGWLREKVHRQGQRYRSVALDRARHRLPARPPPADRGPAPEVFRAVRYLTILRSPSDPIDPCRAALIVRAIQTGAPTLHDPLRLRRARDRLAAESRCRHAWPRSTPTAGW